MLNRIKFLILILLFFGSCIDKTPKNKEKNSSKSSPSNLEFLSDEQRKVYVQNIRSELDSTIAHINYDGKSSRQIVYEHVVELSLNNKLTKITNPVRLVRNNEEAYKNFLNPKDMILYDDKLAIKIDSLRKNNMDFRKQLIRDKLSEFDNRISYSRFNQGSLYFERTPQVYVKAFAVYYRFGSEALTDYINIYQYYTPDAFVQDNRVTTAFEHFQQNSEFKKVDPFEYAEELFSKRK